MATFGLRGPLVNLVKNQLFEFFDATLIHSVVLTIQIPPFYIFFLLIDQMCIIMTNIEQDLSLAHNNFA